MSLTNLPMEVIITIADVLTERDVAQLLPVSKHMHSQLSEYLLKRNVLHSSMRALLWVIRKIGRLPVLHRLIHYGGDINGRFRYIFGHCTGHHITLLHAAAHETHPSMMFLLIELGADPLIVDAQSQTAIYWAFAERDEETIRIIMNKITNITEFFVNPKYHIAPLHLACSVGSTTLIRDCIGIGLGISARDEGGQSPLDRAREFLKHSGPLGKDRVFRWLRLLVMLGEDAGTAYDYLNLPPSYRYPERNRQAERSGIQVGRSWFENPIVYYPIQGGFARPPIFNLINFPPLSRTPDRASSFFHTTNKLWSTTEAAQSVLKNSHKLGTQPVTTTIQTASNSIPSLITKHKNPTFSASFVTVPTTLRRQPAPHLKINQIRSESSADGGL